MAKIMFNDEVNLTQLVLERIKNMTRRTIPQKTLDFVFNDFRHAYYEATLDWLDEKEALEQCFFVDKMKKLPYQIGDVVAIAKCFDENTTLKEIVNWVINEGGWFIDDYNILTNPQILGITAKKEGGKK